MSQYNKNCIQKTKKKHSENGSVMRFFNNQRNIEKLTTIGNEDDKVYTK